MSESAKETLAEAVAACRSPLFEIAPVFVRLDHGARFIVNANERNFADRSARKAYNCLSGG